MSKKFVGSGLRLGIDMIFSGKLSVHFRSFSVCRQNTEIARMNFRDRDLDDSQSGN